jgi:gas vesicle protein
MFGSSRDSDGSSAQGFGLGLLIGAVLGAGAALLLAPASGEQTRKRLKREARRAYVRGADAVEDAWEDGERAARRIARQGMSRGREVLGKL